MQEGKEQGHGGTIGDIEDMISGVPRYLSEFIVDRVAGVFHQLQAQLVPMPQIILIYSDLVSVHDVLDHVGCLQL